MGFSIKRRLLVGLLSITAIVIILATVKNYFDTRHEIEELFDAQLVQAARSLLALSSHELHEQIAYDDQITGEDSTLHDAGPIQIHKYEQSLEFQIWLIGTDRHLAVRSESAPNTPLTDQEKSFTDINVKGTHLRVYALTNEENTIQVQVAENYAEREKLSNAIALQLMASLAIILPLLAILISVVVAKTLEPLNRIAREIEIRGGEDLHAVSDKGVPNEAKPLIKALNQLFNRLHIAFENISRFTADAAHELRTPLAGLKVNTQVALSANDDAVRNEALKIVLSSVDNTVVLVEQLLVLSRLDPEEGLSKNEQTDLHEICEEIIADMATDAIRKKIEIGLDAINPAMVMGRHAMLIILLRNLIQNAIRYTPQQGIIDVTLKQEGAQICLTISDSGPGIPEKEREDVFRRFYRVRGSDAPGTGLGLSIVQRIVEIHQAKLTLATSPHRGLQVNVWFKAGQKQTAQSNIEAA